MGRLCTYTGKWARVGPWDTVFVDLDGNQGILGQDEGRRPWCASAEVAGRERVRLRFRER
ncbi:hypothetical protein [Rhodococcus sp. OK302]|uniref:hypothetical protein n=1 Tax=Rhodococcus sp. OK302 TaxID=1882769 RepID=UPI0015953903|nr:hypothetical protein [Rhodococcus sp. OK302]